MSSVLKQPSQKPNLGRHGFDLSQRRIFSCPVGMLLPVWKDFATAGESYRLNSNAFIRTEAIETAAFIRMKHYVEFFFVPMKQIYMFWGSFFYSTDDVMSTFGEITTSQKGYNLPSGQIYASIFMPKNGQDLGAPFFRDTPTSAAAPDSTRKLVEVDEFGIPRIWNAARLMDMLEYGNTSTTSVFDYSKVPVAGEPTDYWFPAFYLAYHKIFHSHYLNSQYFKNVPSEYNVDKYYGSLIPKSVMQQMMWHIHYRPYRKDYFTAIQPAPIFNSLWANALNSRLTNSVPTNLITEDSISGGEIHLNSTTTGVIDSNDSGNTLGKVTTSPYVASPAHTTGVSATASYTAVGNLRAMFALDRLLRVTASTGSHYDDQVLAHLGVKVPKGISDEAYKLGERVTDIVINEVVATASTSPDQAGGVLGDIAGKAFGSTANERDITFTAPCDGIVMAISSIEPLCDYASNRPDIVNRYLNQFDFWRPETDNLGMQPLWDWPALTNNIGAFPPNGAQNPIFIGWQPRHTELKIKYDVVNQSIFDTYRKSWAGYKQALYDMLGSTPGVSGNAVPTPFAHFYIAPQYTNNVFLRKVPRYLSPDAYSLDPGFPKESVLTLIATNITGQPNNYAGWQSSIMQPNYMYSFDNFLVNLEVKAFKTSPMSPNSLPKFL